MTPHILPALVAATGAALWFPVAAAQDACPAVPETQNAWPATVTGALSRSRSFQYPSAATCLSGSQLGAKKIGGHFFPTTLDGTERVVFGVDGGDGSRAELRSETIDNEYGRVSAKLRIDFETGQRRVTVGQLFKKGFGPVIRIEIRNGVPTVFLKPDGFASWQTESDAWDMTVVRGDDLFYRIEKFSRDSVLVKIAGQERTYSLTNYDDEDWYLKAGCYMSSSGNQPGCRVAFEFLYFTL